MAEIKKIYEDSARTQDIYPITHEKAVIDNNGTTSETKFQMIKDLINQKQMEIGAVPIDLTPTKGNTDHIVSSDGIFNSIASVEHDVEIELLNMNSTGITLSNAYIKSSNSTEAASASLRLWKIPYDGSYKSIKVHVRNSDTGAYGLSFFKSDTINASNKISSYTHSGNAWDDWDVEIPQNTVLICVGTRSSYISNPFIIYGLKTRSVNDIANRVTTLETEKAITPVDFIYFINQRGWDNSGGFISYGNLIGDNRKHLLEDYLVNGYLVIWNEYSGENQVKCKISFWSSTGSYTGYNAWTVLSQGANYINPKNNSAYFSICFGMNNSGGTEINASNPAMYSGVYYMRPFIYNRLSTNNTGDIQELAHRIDVIDNSGNKLTLTPSMGTSYWGKKLEFGNKYYKEDYSISTGGNQAGALYGDLLFTFNSNRKNCYIINMNNRQIVQNISLTEITNFHCNQVQFGTQKYDSGDTFPLLYVDSLYLKNCQVFRVTESEGVYALTLVQTITYPNNYNNPEAFIDRDRNILWVSEELSGTITLHQFSMPTLSQGDVTLSASSSTNSISFYSGYEMQGGMIMDGKAYVCAGLTGGGRFFVIDLYCNKQMETHLFMRQEPQSAFVWNGNLYVLGSGYLYKFYLW